MHDVTSASAASPHLFTPKEPSSPLCARGRMGCSSSSQTSAVDTIRPGAKPEESNGASTTGAANENGKVAEDTETIPDQGPEPAVAAASAGTTAAAPPAGEEPQTPADSAAAPEAAAPADAAAPSEAEAPAEAAAAPEEVKQENAEAAAPDPETKTEEAPAPSE